MSARNRAKLLKEILDYLKLEKQINKKDVVEKPAISREILKTFKRSKNPNVINKVSSWIKEGGHGGPQYKTFCFNPKLLNLMLSRFSVVQICVKIAIMY